MTATIGSADDLCLSIGEALEQLSEEFPDLTVSKIRYLETQGLIEPTRTASGYRQFTGKDLARLVWVLRQQREHFLPLKVIREILARTGGLVPLPDFESKEEVVDREAHPVIGLVSMSIEELSEALDVPSTAVAEIERSGLISSRTAGQASIYDVSALLIARLALKLVGLGLDVRHLRMYLMAAQREAGVLEQLLSGRLTSGDGASRTSARRDLEDLVEVGARLRQLLLQQSLPEFNR